MTLINVNFRCQIFASRVHLSLFPYIKKKKKWTTDIPCDENILKCEVVLKMSRNVLSGYNKLKAKARAFPSDTGHVLRVFLNDLKNIPHKACPLRFCAKEKLA